MLNYRQIAFRKHGAFCNRCSSSKNLTVHHKDQNRKNNNLDNLEVLCEECHNKEHNIKVKKHKVNKKYQRGTNKRKKK